MSVISRRKVLGSCLSISGLYGAAGKLPNILLILTDDQGAHMGALGTRGVSTPCMDRLAQEGTLFTNSFAATASCAPSRTSILTGMYPHSNGTWRNVRLGMIPVPAGITDTVGVKPEIATLPELLNRGGYRTGITAKFHLNPANKFPFHETIAVPNQTPEAFRTVVGKFIGSAAGKPFFLMANTSYPHRPFRKAHFASGRPTVDPAVVDLPANLPDLPEVRADWADYLTSIQCTDAIVGGMLDGLKDSGRAGETIVIFAGDQGPAYVRGKATLYDLGIRVPLIIRGPGVKADQVCRKLTSLIDLAPTILEYAGLPLPDRLQGRSLLKLLSGGNQPSWRELIYAEHNAHGPGDYYPVRSVYDGRMHYLRNLKSETEYAFIADTNIGGPAWDNRAFDPTLRAKEEFPQQYALLQATVRRPPEELYDRASDPYEMHNVVGDRRYAKQLGRLRNAMDQWMKETSDSGDPRMDATKGN